MKILVTGVAGFIGSNIASELIKRGHKVIGVDDLSNGKKLNIPKKCKFYRLDLSDKVKLNKINENIDQIFHLAGQSSGEKSFEDPIKDLEKNTISTLNLINFAIRKKVKKLIFASSQSVYGNVDDIAVSEKYKVNPLSCYGNSKLSSENYLKIFKDKLPYVIFRINNVYGYGQDLDNLKQGMVSIYLAQALKHNKIIVKGSLHRFRDFVHIDDVVDCWIRAAVNRNIKNVIFNLGTGKKTYVKEILYIIRKNFKNIKVIKGKNTPGDQKGIYMNNKLIKLKLKKNTFVPINKGLKDLILKYKNL